MVLFSISIIILLGISLSGIFKKIKLPGLLGMIITGIVLGPYVLNLISPNLLNISKDIREIALIVILTRVGLSLDISELKKVGRSAILMCFIPATFELVCVTILAPLLFGISYIEAAIMGAVLAAVSPAVVVPRMLKLMDEGYGKNKNIPELIMAGASVDDVYVIVLFTSFLGMYQNGKFDVTSLFKIPISIIIGLLVGIISGVILTKVFEKIHVRDTIKIMIILSVGFIFTWFESVIKVYIPMSGLLAVMALGCTILKSNPFLAKRLSNKFSKVWVGAELFLFVLVGAAVDISYLKNAGINTILLLLIALAFRVLGVLTCLIKTNLNKKEKLFCAISYLPKATVQAAIGGIPLAYNVEAGNLILTVAVIAIIITAPIGAIGIDYSYKKLLVKK